MLDAIGERQDVFLSTPSARRATDIISRDAYARLFLSTPSARRATRKRILSPSWGEFLSTPSARRATADLLAAKQATEISIHALREEGDQEGGQQDHDPRNFYPRPPRGGRPVCEG